MTTVMYLFFGAVLCGLKSSQHHSLQLLKNESNIVNGKTDWYQKDDYSLLKLVFLPSKNTLTVDDGSDDERGKYTFVTNFNKLMNWSSGLGSAWWSRIQMVAGGWKWVLVFSFFYYVSFILNCTFSLSNFTKSLISTRNTLGFAFFHRANYLLKFVTKIIIFIVLS